MAIFAALALVMLPLLFADPVDPRSTVRSQFGSAPVRQVNSSVVAMNTDPTPSPRPTVAPARDALPVANPVRSVRATPAATPTLRPAPATTAPVAPVPTTAPVARSSAAERQEWRLQLASYTDEAAAKRFVERLNKDGVQAGIIPATSGSRRLWRVGLDMRASRADAEQYQATLNQRYKIDSLLKER
ncbi:MAG: SPOR domain-containing protein [Oceanococcaceae bacterium]